MNFVTKNAPKLSPKCLSLCSVGQKNPAKFPPNFPPNFPNFPAKNQKNSPTSFCRSAGRTKCPFSGEFYQSFRKHLRSALQLEGFVDALFLSNGVAQLCHNGHRRRQCAKHDVPRLKIHRMRSSNTVWMVHLTGVAGDTQAGWSLAASILTTGVRTAH